jgi:F420H(2)-dependent quinone reductase
VVTTRGAKSGKLRKNPVMRVTDGSAYPLVASKSGSDEQPQWHNLKADPDVRTEIAEEAHGRGLHPSKSSSGCADTES